MYIYSVAGDAFLEYVNGDNNETIRLGSGYTKPLPFYYKESNIESGLILSINEFISENKNEQVVLDLSKLNDTLITYKYHSYPNQIFYLNAIDTRTFKIHCEGSCIAYDVSEKIFKREKCDFSKASDNQLFEIYDDITLDLFKENIPELKEKLQNLSKSDSKSYSGSKSNDCVCPDNLILSGDKKSQINKRPKNCPISYQSKNDEYSLWDEDTNDRYSHFSNASHLKKGAETDKKVEKVQ